jgi:hypothetical protein
MWEVEYTDEFGEWWESLTQQERNAIDKSVTLLESVGLPCHSPIAVTFKDRDMALCGSYGSNVREDRFAPYTHLIPGEWLYC